MLVELNIRNFAIIEEASVRFGPGLNVLSGETGAGKTIIMSALGLLLGARASTDLLRVGANEASVEALFEVEGEAPVADASQWLGEGERELLIRRAIAEGGRSRITANGGLATVAALAKIGAALVQVYGQHEQQTLLRAESHQEILDRYAGLDAMLDGYRTGYERAREIRVRLDELSRRERERVDLLELARFRVAELKRADLKPREDETLAHERALLANATKLAAAAQEVEAMLYGDGAALDAIARAGNRLSEVTAIDPKLGEPLGHIESARVGLEEAAHALRSYADKIETDPARLELIEARVAELNRLKRKYGGTLEAALETLERSRAEIAELEAIESSKAEVEGELSRVLDEMCVKAKALSDKRRRASSELKQRMEAELRTLGMRSPVFESRLATIADAEGAFVHRGTPLGATGQDTVEFYLSPNLGQPPMPLARIASGGELSRVMLALKSLEARRRGVATLIFDEVDAGIGGAVAEVVGRKLKELSRFHQVLCVTHLPQIAAFADTHFMVEKQERRGATRSSVTMLEGAERAAEIARMMGGAPASEKFRRAARELLDRARA